MAIYGATTVVRALLSEHTNNEDRFLINNTGNNGDRVNRIRLRPKAWTNACAWKPAGTCFGADDWDNETCTVRFYEAIRRGMLDGATVPVIYSRFFSSLVL